MLDAQDTNTSVEMEMTMPTGRVKWFSLEKGFGFISSDEGEDVYLSSSALPEGVTTVKPGTKLEFGIAEGRRGPQALSVRIVEAPPSVSGSRGNTEDLAILIEESIKMLDRVGNNLRHGRALNEAEANRVAKVLRGIAGQIEGSGMI
jgi:cold shock protein